MGYPTEQHDFYCINCGKKGIGLMRRKGFKHESMHRKKLFCIYCNREVNHVECITYDEVEQFKMDYENGVYRDEAEESLLTLGSSGFRKVYAGA